MQPVAVLALSLCLIAACSSSTTTCPVSKKEAGALGEYRKSDLPTGSCSQSESCGELQTREPCSTGLGPTVLFACSCQQGAWSCVETGRTKSVCLPEEDASADRPDASRDGAVDGPAPDALEPGACAGPNPGSCYFGGGASGICDHLRHAATCRDGAWVCTDEHGTPLVPASQCRCFVGSTAIYPCRCENGVAICGSPDAATDR